MYIFLENETIFYMEVVEKRNMNENFKEKENTPKDIRFYTRV